MTAIDTTPYLHDGMPVMRLLSDLVADASASLAQTPLGVPDIAGLYHDIPPDDFCNSLILWVREWVPVTLGQFPTPASLIDVCKPIDMDPRLVLSLRRPCAPIPDANGNIDETQETAAAEDMLIDARALTCGVFSTWPARLHTLYPGARIQYGSMTPTSGGQTFGWDFEIMLELTGCRGGCGQ